jgi:hypothetical protein
VSIAPIPRTHLLVLLDDHESEFTDRRSRGIEITTRILSVPGEAEGRYLDLACADPLGFDVFDALGGDLVGALATSVEEPSVAARRLVGKWRRFWLTPPEPQLTREEQIGLFAELWFICYWLTPKAGIERAIEAWRGALGARHDFELPGYSIEVKAATSAARRAHQIHGIEQLALPGAGKLYLFSLSLREEGGALNTLPSIVHHLRDLASESDEAIVTFETRLALSHYSSAASSEYEALRLRIVDERLYEVDGDFPRLLPSSLKEGVPSGVGNIRYSINLSGFDEHIVASVSAQAPFE